MLQLLLICFLSIGHVDHHAANITQIHFPAAFRHPGQSNDRAKLDTGFAKAFPALLDLWIRNTRNFLPNHQKYAQNSTHSKKHSFEKADFCRPVSFIYVRIRSSAIT
ncbi:hypothetical protein [Thalassospira sp.]|uniref:hypothetical protein n=1 Tax=Thalassospira sp. TaxID=1912094 RepID=UPI003AA8713F